MAVLELGADLHERFAGMFVEPQLRKGATVPPSLLGNYVGLRGC